MIKLNATSLILKKEAEERLKEVGDKIDYESLGISPPEDEEEEITDEDFEKIYTQCYLDPREILLVIGKHEEDGSVVYAKSGLEISVNESVEEVKHLIDMKISLRYMIKHFVVSLKKRIFVRDNKN